MSTHEIYLNAASLFNDGYLDFKTFDEIFRLWSKGVEVSDPRWSPLLAKGRRAYYKALETSDDGVTFSRGPLYEQNQQRIAAPFLEDSERMN